MKPSERYEKHVRERTACCQSASELLKKVKETRERGQKALRALVEKFAAHLN